MKDLKQPKLSGPETGYFQVNNQTFLSLVVKEVHQVDLPTEASFLKTFDFLPFGAAISESVTSDFFYANKVLLQALNVPLTEFQVQGLQLFTKRSNDNIQLLWKKLKELISIHKQNSHEAFGCVIRYNLLLHGKRMRMMHNINEFFPASGHRSFLHVFLPDPEANYSSSEIYIPCSQIRWKSLSKIEQRQRSSNPALSNRENQVLDEVAKGKTSKEISEILGLSVHTVKIHRKSILKKLKVHNTVEALAKLNA